MGQERLPWEQDPTMQPIEPDSQAGDEFTLDQDQEANEDLQDETEDQDKSLAQADEAQQLRQAFQALEQLVHDKSRQVDQLVEALDHAQANVSTQTKDREEQDFLNQIRELYDQDPVSGTYHMIKKFQEDALNDYDSRMQQQLQDHSNHSRFMDDFFADPANAELRAHRDELEFLIREQGLDPETAALIVRNIVGRGSHASAKRDAAARAVRNRSMVENAGEVGEPAKKDADFDRILKRSKTLDEMFDGLSKIRL